MDKIATALDTNIAGLREAIEMLILLDTGMLATLFTFMVIFIMMKAFR